MPRYEVLTWDTHANAYTPDLNGTYTLFGLRTAIRELRNLSYPCDRDDPSVLIRRLPEGEPSWPTSTSQPASTAKPASV